MSSLCEELFSGLLEGALRAKEVVSLWVLATLEGLGSGALIGVAKTVLLAGFTCILAVGGAVVGAVHGAMKGQTTETGFSIGAGVGGLTGAIVAIQLMDLVVHGQSLSKVALLGGLVNGKVFMEWVSYAVLKAYHWQVSTLESYREVYELYDIIRAQGLSPECIQNIPQTIFCSGDIIDSSEELCCTICLQVDNVSCNLDSIREAETKSSRGFCRVIKTTRTNDESNLQELEDGEYTRELPICKHLFHLACIDIWLRRQGSCPMCRVPVGDNTML